MSKKDYPPDIWDITFDINKDGSADVTFDIIMAVPDDEERPLDYLNFGTNETDFKAIDYDTKEPIQVKIKRSNRGKTVFIVPARNLNLGDRYHYILSLKQRNLISETDDCYVMNWGWGSWPLIYSIK